MAKKYHVWSNFVRSRAGPVLEVVKDVNFTRNCLCRNNLVHLWHKARLIYLTLVINL